MEMLLAAGHYVLVSGERETSGESILKNSEVNRFLLTTCSLRCSTTSMWNRTVSFVTAPRVGTLATGWTIGSRSLDLEKDGRHSSCFWNLRGVTTCCRWRDTRLRPIHVRPIRLWPCFVCVRMSGFVSLFVCLWVLVSWVLVSVGVGAGFTCDWSRTSVPDPLPPDRLFAGPPKFSLSFFPLSRSIFFFFLSLGVSSWNSGRGAKVCASPGRSEGCCCPHCSSVDFAFSFGSPQGLCLSLLAPTLQVPHPHPVNLPPFGSPPLHLSAPRSCFLCVSWCSRVFLAGMAEQAEIDHTKIGRTRTGRSRNTKLADVNIV